MISVFHHISDVAPGSPLRSLFDEAELICIFRQSKVDNAQAVIEITGLDPSCRHLIQTLPRGTHLRVRGARLPAIVVETTRTELEEPITFTDGAFEEDI